MTTESFVQALAARVAKSISHHEVLTEADLWTQHGALVFRAQRFEGAPCFYPVYRLGDYYSYSVLHLLAIKGALHLNARAVESARAPDFLFHSGHDTLDAEIARLGGPHRCGFEIRGANEYAERIAHALLEDVLEIEARNPGTTNIVLCGGKDSLNLLLLPWRNPTVVASADPNYPLVKHFVADNGLDFHVVHLLDSRDAAELEHEVLENCCRVDLQHWRWGAHLRKLSAERAGKVVFWKGQVADLYTTNKWKAFMHPPRRIESLARKVYRRLERPLPEVVNYAIARQLQPRVIDATWTRCAMFQGGHMGFIRALADCLVVSAYHGPRMVEVFGSVDLGAAAQVDMRPLIGRILAGRDVRYPSENPAPPPSMIREGLSHPNVFRMLAETRGLRVEA